jgi:hypothetical protein
MHLIALVLMVAFVRTIGDDRVPIAHVYTAEGGTLESCKAEGQRRVNLIRQVEGVASAEFTCVDFNMKAAI